MTNEQREAMEAAKSHAFKTCLREGWWVDDFIMQRIVDVSVEAGYKAAVDAERERIIAEIEEFKVEYTGSPEFRVAFNQALKVAIAVVKGDLNNE